MAMKPDCANFVFNMMLDPYIDFSSSLTLSTMVIHPLIY